jgi:hypothetical protein
VRGELDDLLAYRRHGHQDEADGKHGDPDRESRPEHRLAPVLGPFRCPLRITRCRYHAGCWHRVLPAAERPTPDQPREEP